MAGDSGLTKNTSKKTAIGTASYAVTNPTGGGHPRPTNTPQQNIPVTNPTGGGHPRPADTPQQNIPMGSVGTVANNGSTAQINGNNLLPNGPVAGGGGTGTTPNQTTPAQNQNQNVNTSTDPNIITVNGVSYYRKNMSEKDWLALQSKYPKSTGGGTGGGTNTGGNNTGGTPGGTGGTPSPYSPESVLNNPSSIYKNTMSSQVKNIDANAPGTTITAPEQKNIAGVNASTATAAQAQFQSAGNAQTAANVNAKPVETYQAQTTLNDVMQNGQMTAAQGTVNQDHLITPEQYDVEGLYTGVNKDGTTNWAGQALNDWAEQNLDTVDERATMKGQLELLQSEFTGPNGEPKIPVWAAATARSVGRIAAFNGVTGTAATAAMAQALMEASLPIAQQDAQLYATLTLQNLNNKQASILNKANVLAKFELTNLDNRMLAAVENSKAFLQMDLQNLANEQQAQIVNTQARVQSILEDAKAVNTQRLFTAQSTNEQNRFYDELNSSIDMYNTSQVNGMNQFNAAQKNSVNVANAQMQTQTSQFNAAQVNSVKMFNANLEMQQDQFYKTMQYNVDLSNARWRQTVTLTNSQMQFDAAAMDVKNQFDLSQEALNRMWDRTDQLLNYAWQSSENGLERNARIALAQLQGDMASDAADKAGLGSMIGSIVSAGADSFFKDFDWDIS